MQVAGLSSVKLFGYAPDLTTLQYIKAGTEQGAIMVPLVEAGWDTADALARAFAAHGDVSKVKTYPLPLPPVGTAQSLTTFNSFQAFVKNIAPQFQKLWGLS
jgi:hypothetical protein